MKENRYAPFLKWYPYLARSSPRWNTLSLAEKGFFHELYDLAAISEPRGTLLMNGVALDSLLLSNLFREPEDRIGAMLARFCGLGLLSKNLVNAFYFPDWNTHQRNGPLRRRTSGTDSAPNGHKLGAPDVDVDVEVEVEVDKEEVEEGGAPSPSDIVNAWNKLGKPFPPVAQLTTKRSRALRLRLANDYWRNNWQVALETISKSPFCKGENDWGWVANFDFFLRPDTVTKTREGAYDENAAPSASAKVKAKLAQWAGKGGKP